MHRQRAKYFFANDIALITLDEPFDISKRIINPICLPHKLDHIGEKWNYQQLIISGWGEYDKSKCESDILQSAIVEKVGNIYFEFIAIIIQFHYLSMSFLHIFVL